MKLQGNKILITGGSAGIRIFRDGEAMAGDLVFEVLHIHHVGGVAQHEQHPGIRKRSRDQAGMHESQWHLVHHKFRLCVPEQFVDRAPVDSAQVLNVLTGQPIQCGRIAARAMFQLTDDRVQGRCLFQRANIRIGFQRGVDEGGA